MALPYGVLGDGAPRSPVSLCPGNDALARYYDNRNGRITCKDA